MVDPALKPMRILIFDDDLGEMLEEYRLLFERSKEFNFRVSGIATIAGILEFFAGSAQFDAYVVDLEFNPDPSPAPELRIGHAIVEALAFARPGTPVVVYSAYPGLDDRLRASMMGARYFVAKKADSAQELIRSIEFILKAESRTLHESADASRVLREAFENPEHINGWIKSKARFVAIADGKIRCGGATRFEALHNYLALRRGQEHLPPDPFISPELFDAP